jgi:hypothetical protein
MDVYKPLRAALFSYELLRFLFLAFSFAFFSSLQAVITGGFFPYLVFMSSNALFPLIGFFLLLRPGEYQNYIPLYMAVKIIAVVLFYVWAVFSLPPETGFMGRESFIEGLIILGGAFFISVGDALSVFGAWVLKRKFLQVESRGIDGGLGCE